MAFQELSRVRSVKHVEQKAFDGGVSHRGCPGCVDCGILALQPAAPCHERIEVRRFVVQGVLQTSRSAAGEFQGGDFRISGN